MTLNQTAATLPSASFRTSDSISDRAHSLWNRLATGLVALAIFLAIATTARASTNPLLDTGSVGTTAAKPTGEAYSLKLHHLHTGESIDLVYRIGDTYLPDAMDKLNHFLRDHRTNDVSHYDPKEFDALHNILAKLDRPNGVIDVVCGYRTPWSNNFLRTKGGTASPASTGVAKNSQHTLAKAIDIRIAGVTTAHLRDIALSLAAGGVGYYPVSQFVHVDVGPVRTWSFSGKGDN